MPDQVVTVRMPATLIAELKERTERDHYRDLSEQIRSIVRKGCLQYSNPVTHEIKELKAQLKEELLAEHEDVRAKTLLDDLRKLLEKGNKENNRENGRGGELR